MRSGVVREWGRGIGRIREGIGPLRSFEGMKGEDPMLHGRCPFLVLLCLIPFASPQATRAGDAERFSRVKEWKGTLTVDANAASTAGGQTQWDIHHHLDISFTLKDPDQDQPPHLTWTGCLTGL